MGKQNNFLLSDVLCKQWGHLISKERLIILPYLAFYFSITFLVKLRIMQNNT